MEEYDVIIIDFKSKQNIQLRVTVDEAETTEKCSTYLGLCRN